MTANGSPPYKPSAKRPSAAARSAVLTAQSVLLVLAARWIGVHSGKQDMTDVVTVMLWAALGLFVAAVVVVIRGEQP